MARADRGRDARHHRPRPPAPPPDRHGAGPPEPGRFEGRRRAPLRPPRRRRAARRGRAAAAHAPPSAARWAPHGAPPYGRYGDAGINDWGRVSPVTPDHVNPERPWPHLEKLEGATEAKGYLLLERLALHPSYAREAETWVDERLRPGGWAASG